MQVGSIVECIKDHGNPVYQACLGNRIITPKKGLLYTIRGYHICNGRIYLEEINNRHLSRFCETRTEPTFNKKRFVELLPPIDLEAEIKQEQLITI